MTDKEYSIQKKRIKKFIHKWSEVFELDQWDMVFYWSRAFDEDNPDCRAQVRGRWQYRHASIEFFLPVFAEEENDDDVERTIIHELIHVILLPLAQNGKKNQSNEHEYSTVSLQRVIVRAYEMGQKEK